MKNLFTFLATLAVAFFPSFAHATGVTAEEKEWLSALRVVIDDAKAAGHVVPSVLVLEDQVPDRSPIYLAFNDVKRECSFVVAVRGNPATAILTASARNADERFLHMVALWAHEYSHCLAYLAGDAATASSQGLQAGQLHIVSSRENEATADLYAMAWIQRVSPEDFSSVERLFKRLRTDLVPDQQAIYEVAGYLTKATRLATMMAEPKMTPYNAAKQLVAEGAVLATASR